MKRIRNELWAKCLAVLLFLLCAAMCLASCAGVMLFREYGVYGKSRQSVQNSLEQAALTKYSVSALSNYLGKSDLPLSEDYKYAIYEGSVKSSEKTAEGKKLAGNADGSFPSTAVVHTFRTGPDQSFKTADSIFDSAYVSEQYDSFETMDFDIGQLRMISNMDGLFISFYDDESSLYRIKEDLWHTDTNDENWKTLYLTDSEGAALNIPRSQIKTVDINASANGGNAGANGENAGTDSSMKTDNADLAGSGSTVLISPKELSQISFSDWTATISAEQAENTTTYSVVSYAGTDAGTGDDPEDLFVQVSRFVSLAYLFRYPAAVMIPASLLLGLLCFLFLMYAAGHRKQDGDQIVLRGPDRMPMDLGLVILLALVGILLAAASSCTASDNMVLIILVTAFAAVLSACLTLLFCMSAAVNLKAGTLWKRTIICRLLGWLNGKRTDLRKHTEGISMKKRIWVLFFLFVFLELAGIFLLTYDCSPLFLVAWLFEKVLFFLLLAKILREFGQLKQTAEEIASGNMDAKAETSNMFLDFEQHGNALNRIGSGLSEAVDERIRSERMKTELITNVSHDIKTPLTSIISYTDLLARLDLEDPQAKEYIEVLSRQSERLKKLIEDLIEASKASSGTLKMEMETVDAGMVLAQAIGEFDEKMKKRNIDYFVRREVTDPMVRADSRYLWRIFDNLLSNICKYAQPGTRAYIDMTETDRQVSITFRNVSEAPLHISGEELKARFVQGDSSRAAEGSGLGLSIADSLAGLMGGALNLIVDGDLFKVELTLQKAGK